MTALVSTEVRVTVGVDTHADVRVAAALDQLGRLLATQSVPSTQVCYRGLVTWASRLGALARFWKEGTSSYGAGLTRWLRSRGVELFGGGAAEASKPPPAWKVRCRRCRGSGACRTGWNGDFPAQGWRRSCWMLRVLQAARRSAVKARTQAA